MCIFLYKLDCGPTKCELLPFTRLLSRNFSFLHRLVRGAGWTTRVFGNARWRKDWVRMSIELAQYRQAWSLRHGQLNWCRQLNPPWVNADASTSTRLLSIASSAHTSSLCAMPIFLRRDMRSWLIKTPECSSSLGANTLFSLGDPL